MLPRVANRGLEQDQRRGEYWSRSNKVLEQSHSEREYWSKSSKEKH